MPPQQGVRRRDRGDLPQGRTANSVRSGRQPTAIFVRETQPTSTKLTPQEAVLFNQVRDCLPFPAGQPAGQHTQHHLQRRGVDHEPDLISWAGLKDIGRVMEHYAFDVESQLLGEEEVFVAKRVWESKPILRSRSRSSSTLQTVRTMRPTNSAHGHHA